MTIKISIRDLVNSSQALGDISNLKLKGKHALRISRVVTVVNVELQNLEAAMKSLRAQYWQDPDAQSPEYVGKTKKEREATEKAFRIQVDETLDEEVELNTEKIDPAIFDEVNDVRAVVLSVLKWLWIEE